MMRRGDCPRYVAQMQQAVLGVMNKAKSVQDLQALAGEAMAVYEQYRSGLSHAQIADLIISRRVSTVTYSRRCLEAGAVGGYRRAGIQVAPGMTIQYVVRDARNGLADPIWGVTEVVMPTISASLRRPGTNCCQFSYQNKRSRGSCSIRESNLNTQREK